MSRILFWFRNNSPDSAILWTHAAASFPRLPPVARSSDLSYPVGVSELTFDTDSVINHYATNASKPPAAKHCTFDALCGISERFLDC